MAFVRTLLGQKERNVLPLVLINWTKINDEIGDFYSTINHYNLLDIYRTVHPMYARKTFSNAHGVFTKTGHMMSCETNLNIFKRWEVIRVFSNHTRIKLEINKLVRKKCLEINTALNSQCVKKEITRVKIIKFLC
jgi:hypothetical protein